jgi:hypothetical protein
MPEEEIQAPGQESARHATGLGVPRVFHNMGWYVLFFGGDGAMPMVLRTSNQHA